ncbi:MAG TPA: DUF2380 domain-containing protein [Gemmatimonadales bacterium]|nr:DUF2380 domain-containing protein [Gemmatimonadales bacterium]
MFARTLLLPGFLLAGLATPVLGQSLVHRPLEPATAPVAALTSALYNDQANLREATDSAKAALATEVLRSRLTEQLGAQLVPYPLIDSLAHSSAALELTGGIPCDVKVACARMVASQAGARWVVMTKVSKTSNLIWLLSAQLIRVSTGEIILDDSTELKGAPEEMVRVGVRIFADRVARTVRTGGHADDFPNGEPAP